MANICWTWYYVEGDVKELQTVYKMFTEIANGPEPSTPMSYGSVWLGNLIKMLGEDPYQYDCAGSIQVVEMESDGTLVLQTESKWVPCHDVFKLLKERFPSLKFWWQGEELGCLYYVTNDTGGNYFPDRYYVAGGDFDSRYYNLGEENTLIQDVNDYLHTSFSSIEEIKQATEDDDELFIIECEEDENDHLADD